MKLLLLLFLFQQQPLSATELVIDSVRNLYYKASTDKTAFEKLSRIMEQVNTSSSPRLICYKGAAGMMKAKYAINPYVKLKDFNSGKALVEESIKMDSTVTETRFIRFAIQTNLPSFLGYNRSIMTDKRFLITHLNHTEDLKLKDDIYKYLSGSSYCTAEELEELKQNY